MDKEDCISHEPEIRKGPWTMEEDLILISYIAKHGEGVWNTLARSAGLKRTGKSCRLRWLNYLRPDVRRGNITPEEQLLIMELHSRWGNSWSRIARQLPGRTDNEIKNFWRTKIQKKLKSGTQPLGYHHSAMPLEASGSRQMIIDMEDGAGTSPSASSTSTTAIDAAVFLQPSPSDDGGGGFWSMEDLWTMQLFDNEPVN